MNMHLPNYYQTATSMFASGVTVCRTLDLDGREQGKSMWEDSIMEIRVGSQRFEDEYRKTKVIFGCSLKDRVEEKSKWPGDVCNKGVGNNLIFGHGCKKRIIRDIVEWKEVCLTQANRSSAKAVRLIGQSHMGLIPSRYLYAPLGMTRYKSSQSCICQIAYKTVMPHLL